MTLAQLRAFVAVVDHGTIRAAARALGMEQSGLTQQMKRLEATLASPLFSRANKGITLTEKGAELLHRARLILSECDRAEQLFFQQGGELIGEINAGFSSELFTTLVPASLHQLRTTNPRVSVHISSGPSNLLLSGIREGRLDFAITLVSEGTDVSDLSSAFLQASAPRVLCRRGHPLQGARRLKQLCDAEWINTRRFSRERTPGNRLSDWFSDNDLPPPKVVASIESLFDSLTIVAKTDYLFLAPASVLEEGGVDLALEAINIAEAIPGANLCFVQRADVPLAPAAAEFARILQSYASLIRRRRAG